jgi:hypothetical protein
MDKSRNSSGARRMKGHSNRPPVRSAYALLTERCSERFARDDYEGNRALKGIEAGSRSLEVLYKYSFRVVTKEVSSFAGEDWGLDC